MLLKFISEEEERCYGLPMDIIIIIHDIDSRLICEKQFCFYAC